MQQRVQILHRRHSPSSAAQLPITAALHAEDLTLFSCILHHIAKFVNTQMRILITVSSSFFLEFFNKNIEILLAMWYK